MIMRTLSLAATLALAALGAQAADLIYKSTMPDGRVIYGESPWPGAKRVDKVQPGPEQAGVITVTPQDVARANSFPQSQGPAVTVLKPREDNTRLQQRDAGGQQGYQTNPGRNLPRRDY